MPWTDIRPESCVFTCAWLCLYTILINMAYGQKVYLNSWMFENNIVKSNSKVQMAFKLSNLQMWRQLYRTNFKSAKPHEGWPIKYVCPEGYGAQKLSAKSVLARTGGASFWFDIFRYLCTVVFLFCNVVFGSLIDSNSQNISLSCLKNYIRTLVLREGEVWNVG